MSPIRRRQFLIASGALLAAPLVRAQGSERIYRIGWPIIAPHDAVKRLLAALEDGLRNHGYSPGKNILIDIRSAEGSAERFPDVVRELVRSNPDVIVTGQNPSTMAVKAATQSIPTVMVVGTDVIRTGLVKSLAKPGGNITGLAWDVGEGTVEKKLELLKEAAPAVTRVAVLVGPPYDVEYRDAVERAAAKLRLKVFWKVRSDDLKKDFADMVRQGCRALIVFPDALLWARNAELVALAAQHRLPAMYAAGAEAVDLGGLMSYSPNIPGGYRTAARFVDRILKGAKPADIPVEQSAVFELVINLKTAKALGIAIPQSLLLRADRLIE